MNHFQAFLARRKHKESLQIHEVEEAYNAISEKDEKLDFLMDLEKQVYESESKEYPSADAKELNISGNENLLRFIEREKNIIRNDDFFSLMDDEVNAEVILSRRQVSILHYFLMKYKASKNINPNRISPHISALTGHSKQNIRIDLAENNMEIILEQTETDTIENILTRIISELRAHRNKKL